MQQACRTTKVHAACELSPAMNTLGGPRNGRKLKKKFLIVGLFRSMRSRGGAIARRGIAMALNAGTSVVYRDDER